MSGTYTVLVREVVESEVTVTASSWAEARAILEGGYSDPRVSDRTDYRVVSKTYRSLRTQP